MAAKVKLSIAKIEGQGVDIQRVLDGLRNLKTELQSLGCKVSVNVEGMELEAGNETRTRDILLGKNSVTPTRETVTAANPAEWEQCGKCGEFRIKFQGRVWEIDTNTGKSKPVNVFECCDCGHLWNEVAE